MRVCCVLASDANFFDQLRAAIATITAARATIADAAIDIAVVAIDLAEQQIAALKAAGIIVHERVDDLPLFAGAPRHAYSLTCRPFIPQFLPGYEGYIWVDSDVRFLEPAGLQYYVGALRLEHVSAVIAQETEPSYCINIDPKMAYAHHSQFFDRLAAVYGIDVAEYFRYFTQYNAGLFAARADSPLWVRYRRNLGKAMRVAYHNILEQDAMNVSLFEVGGQLRAPASMNWLCSMTLPMRRGDGRWCSCEDTSEVIYVAHLSNSSDPLNQELYRRIGIN